MAKIDLQLIAENVEEYENLVRNTDWTNINYNILTTLFNRTIQAEQIISNAKSIRPESTWIDGRAKRLEELVSENKGRIVKEVDDEFMERAKELDLIADSNDINLLVRKRPSLDELCSTYVSLNQGKVPSRKIKKYNFAMKKRGPIQERLERIKGIYLSGNWQNVKTLKRLAKGSFFNNLNLANVIKNFGKIDFYEGIAEAKRLQNEIFYFIDNFNFMNNLIGNLNNFNPNFYSENPNELQSYKSRLSNLVADYSKVKDFPYMQKYSGKISAIENAVIKINDLISEYERKQKEGKEKRIKLQEEEEKKKREYEKQEKEIIYIERPVYIGNSLKPIEDLSFAIPNSELYQLSEIVNGCTKAKTWSERFDMLREKISCLSLAKTPDEIEYLEKLNKKLLIEINSGYIGHSIKHNGLSRKRVDEAISALQGYISQSQQFAYA